MTDARRKTKIWLLQQKKTFADIASISGLAEATIHNTLDGRGSTKSKQFITNALGIQLWEDVTVTERYITVRPRVSIEFPEARIAREWSNHLPRGAATQRGRTLTFAKTCSFVVRIATTLRAKNAQSGKTLRRNNEPCHR